MSLYSYAILNKTQGLITLLLDKFTKYDILTTNVAL